MSLAVRGLQPADRPRWNELWRGYQDFYSIALPAAVSNETWRRLLDPAEPVFGLVVEDAGANGGIVGLAHYLLHRSTWMTADACYLQDLYVDPAFRGRGAARALIEAVYARADAHGAGQVYWLTHQTNTAARKLYDRLAVNAGFIAYERVVEIPGK